MTGLLFANLLVALLAILLDWRLSELLWPFWIQSVIIGLYAARRIFALKRFDVEGFKINGKPAVENDRTRRWTGVFFLFHYGFFHAAYCGFLLAQARPDSDAWLWIGAAGASFLIQQHTEYGQSIGIIQQGRPNIGTLMFLPYLRVLPMHVTIIFGATSVGGADDLWVILFTLLKTGADLGMDRIESRVLAKAAASQPVGGAMRAGS